MSIFTGAEKKQLTFITSVATISLTTVIPFALMLIPFQIRKLENLRVVPVYGYGIFFLSLFYIAGAARYLDIQLFFIGAVLALLPIYLLTQNRTELFKGLIVVGYIILASAIGIEQLNVSLFSDTFKRATGLHHNAFYASQITVLIALITVHHRYMITPKFVIIGFILGGTLTRSAIILIPFLLHRPFTLFLILAGAVIYLGAIESAFPGALSTRTQITANIEQRIETIDSPVNEGYAFWNGYGLNQAYKHSSSNQNPHNIFLSAFTQLGIMSGIIVLTIYYAMLLYYGYKHGYWKILPLIFYDNIDGSVMNNHSITAIYIIYLYFMSRTPIFNGKEFELTKANTCS